MISRPRLNIAFRDAMIATIIVFFISCTAGYVVYINAIFALKTEVKNNLLNISKTAAEFLDKDSYKKITKPEDYGSSLYEKAREPFFKILKANTDIKFIYTVAKQDDKYFFILDASIPKQGEIYQPSTVMTEYTNASDNLKRAIEEQIFMVEDNTYTDEYGTFLSGYTPIYNNNEFIGVVGADISVVDFLKNLNRIKKSFLYGALVSIFASVILGGVLWFLRQYTINAKIINNQQQEKIKQIELDRLEYNRLLKIESEKKRQTELNQIASNFEHTVQEVVHLVVLSSEQLRDEAEKVTNIAKDTIKRSSSVADEAIKAVDSSKKYLYQRISLHHQLIILLNKLLNPAK